LESLADNCHDRRGPGGGVRRDGGNI